MVFVLQRRSVGLNHDNYFVVSGQTEIGHIWLAQGYDVWHWKISGLNYNELVLGMGHGVARTREAAMTDFAQQMRKALAHSGFREIEPGEMVFKDEVPQQ